MKEWRVVIKTEKTIECMPDILYIKDVQGSVCRLTAKYKVDSQLNSSCEYHLDRTAVNPEIYISVQPYSVQRVYILCKMNDDILYEKCVSYDDVPDLLYITLANMITKQLYKNE